MALVASTIRPLVRSASGIDTDVDIDDTDLDIIINIAIRQAIEDIYHRRWEEGLVNENEGDPLINGTNKIFFVDNPPIADYDNDGDVDGDDITVTYYDADLDLKTAVVTVSDARRGKLSVTTGGSTP